VQFLAALLFLLFQTAPQPLQERPALVEGVVLAATSGEPLARAEVSLFRLTPPAPVVQTGQPAQPPPRPAPIPAVSTERDGKFVFRNLQPGEYLLRVKRNGYAPQEYGQRTPTSSGLAFNLIDGQQMKDVVFKLAAGAVVAGRVRDTGGEPIHSATVSLLRLQYLATGERSYYVVGSATTDDRGEYRVFWVPAGRYVVGLSPNASIFQTAIRDQYAFSDRRFPMMYYPGAVDPSRATAIEPKAGETLPAVDFIVNPPALFSVRGKVVDATTGKPAPQASVRLETRQSLPSDASSSNAAVSFEDGTFEIRSVLPDTYWLRSSAMSNQPVNPAAVGAARTSSDLIDAALSNRTFAQMPVDVTNADIEGLTLALSPPISIPVRLSAEGQELSSIPGYERVRIQIRSTSPNPDIINQRSPFTAEGTSVLNGVNVGEYKIFLLPMPDLYIKAVTFDQIDAINRPFQVTNSTTATLNVVVSAKPGQVEGNLVDAASQPVRGNRVVLIPDQARERADLYKSAQTDQNGRFVIRGIPPGGYKLFSWESLESNGYFDREILSEYEAQGKPVRIQESSKETVDIRMIPAR
jgi:hypothetical protein